jgi:hypothetical protein
MARERCAHPNPGFSLEWSCRANEKTTEPRSANPYTSQGGPSNCCARSLPVEALISEAGEPSMKKRGSGNQLLKQAGENLVCAELARRGFYATLFAGNVPGFDVLAANDAGRIVRVQVKASKSHEWGTQAGEWMKITIDGDKQQFHGPRQLDSPRLIYVCVAVGAVGHNTNTVGPQDRFFVLTAEDLQEVCIKGYSEWMEPRQWKRPKNPNSLDCRYDVVGLARFENNWALIEGHLEEPTE